MAEVGDSESSVQFYFIYLFIELNLTRKHKTLLVFENRLFGFLLTIKLAIHAVITLVILSYIHTLLSPPQRGFSGTINNQEHILQ